jgi:hypothetical protein
VSVTEQTAIPTQPTTTYLFLNDYLNFSTRIAILHKLKTSNLANSPDILKKNMGIKCSKISARMVMLKIFKKIRIMSKKAQSLYLNLSRNNIK